MKKIMKNLAGVLILLMILSPCIALAQASSQAAKGSKDKSNPTNPVTKNPSDPGKVPTPIDPTTGKPIASKSGTGWDIGSIKGFGLPEAPDGITGIIVNILYWLLLMLGVVGIGGFVVSGIMYIASRGDDTAMTKAKKAMTYSVYGIVVGLSGVVVITAVENLLYGEMIF